MQTANLYVYTVQTMLILCRRTKLSTLAESNRLESSSARSICRRNSMHHLDRWIHLVSVPWTHGIYRWRFNWLQAQGRPFGWPPSDHVAATETQVYNKWFSEPTELILETIFSIHLYLKVRRFVEINGSSYIKVRKNPSPNKIQGMRKLRWQPQRFLKIIKLNLISRWIQ